MYVCMYVYTHIHVYMFTYIHTLHYIPFHSTPLHYITLHYIHTYIYIYAVPHPQHTTPQGGEHSSCISIPIPTFLLLTTTNYY